MEYIVLAVALIYVIGGIQTTINNVQTVSIFMMATHSCSIWCMQIPYCMYWNTDVLCSNTKNSMIMSNDELYTLQY